MHQPVLMRVERWIPDDGSTAMGRCVVEISVSLPAHSSSQASSKASKVHSLTAVTRVSHLNLAAKEHDGYRRALLAPEM